MSAEKSVLTLARRQAANDPLYGKTIGTRPGFTGREYAAENTVEKAAKEVGEQ